MQTDGNHAGEQVRSIEETKYDEGAGRRGARNPRIVAQKSDLTCKEKLILKRHTEKHGYSEKAEL